MADTVLIKPADQTDIDFVIEAIIRSQKSGTDRITYCSLYSLTEEELRAHLRDIMNEDLEGIIGHEFNLSGFLVCRINGERAGAMGGWVEGIDGLPSSIIKTNLLLKQLGREKLETAMARSALIKDLNYEREDGALQLEYLLVEDRFWLKGIFVKLLIGQMKRHMNGKSDAQKAQAIMFKDNDRSYQAFQRIGFDIIEEKTADHRDVLNIYPHDTRILMEFESAKIPGLLQKFHRFLETTKFQF